MTGLTLDDNHSLYQIRSYKPGSIRVNDKTITSSIIITPNELFENWQPRHANEITVASLKPLLKLNPDVLLIGTGHQLIFLSPEIYGEFINHGIGVEIMNSSAACRTFNVLSAENRRIAAALIV